MTDLIYLGHVGLIEQGHSSGFSFVASKATSIRKVKNSSNEMKFFSTKLTYCLTNPQLTAAEAKQSHASGP